MNKKEIILDNGMKLVLVNTNKFKTVNVGVTFEDKMSDKDITCDRLLIKLVDNTSYEIRLPSYDFGQKLVDLFESLKGQPQKVIIENQNSQPNKAQLLSEYQELLNSGAITQEEYDKLKQETLFN